MACCLIGNDMHETQELGYLGGLEQRIGRRGGGIRFRRTKVTDASGSAAMR